MRVQDTTRKREGFQGQKAIVVPKKILNDRCSKNEIISALYITDIGYYPKARYHYRERLHGAEEHILIYCSQGSGTVTIRKKQLVIESGDFFVIPSNMPHVYMSDEQNPWTFYRNNFQSDRFANRKQNRAKQGIYKAH
jgi:mannose-6-phosphate isomerase-like protein (cupin superfamily)